MKLRSKATRITVNCGPKTAEKLVKMGEYEYASPDKSRAKGRPSKTSQSEATEDE